MAPSSYSKVTSTNTARALAQLLQGEPLLSSVLQKLKFLPSRKWGIPGRMHLSPSFCTLGNSTERRHHFEEGVGP